MEGEIKRLKRELKCEGAITKYYKDTVLLPNGNTAVWDFVGHNGAAAVVPGAGRWKTVNGYAVSKCT